MPHSPTPSTVRDKSRPTMRQIAAKAGVSATTVAHVLNRTKGTYVAETTRQRVLDAAETLNYQAALLNRSIKAPLKHLGVIVSDTDQALIRSDAMQIFEGIRQEAIVHDYLTVLLPMAPEVHRRYSADRAVQAIRQLHQTKLLDGFVIDKASFLSDAVRQLDQAGIPLATVNGAPTTQLESDRLISAAITDNRIGGRLATQHLIDLGHSCIGLLTRPWAHYPEDHRPFQVSQIVRGHRDALEAAGITENPALILDAHPWDKATTYAAVDRLMDADDPPTALFAADDAIAVMAIQRLSLRGLRVPKDVSVVGYGDWSQAARLSEPALTSVHTDLLATGKIASRLVIQILAGKATRPEHVHLPPELHIRESTASRDLYRRRVLL